MLNRLGYDLVISLIHACTKHDIHVHVYCIYISVMYMHEHALFSFIKTYAWPLLSTLFSEVLSKEEWLQLLDNILSNHPSFLVLVAAAYISAARQTLMRCTRQDDVQV